jgi:hypothetical protein
LDFFGGFKKNQQCGNFSARGKHRNKKHRAFHSENLALRSDADFQIAESRNVKQMLTISTLSDPTLTDGAHCRCYPSSISLVQVG